MNSLSASGRLALMPGSPCGQGCIRLIAWTGAAFGRRLGRPAVNVDRRSWSRRKTEEAAMRVLVMGAGAVGGYYGGMLALRGHAVTFVARGANLTALRERGLEIRTGGQVHRLQPVTAVESPAT